MENLNAEQIKKALECCVEGECDGCTYDDQTSCKEYLLNDALSLIKELTQANKQLSESYAHSEKAKDELIAERSRLSIDLQAMRGAANAYKMHIVEITKENEKLRADIAKEFTCVFGQPHKVTDCPIDDEIAKAKADTVRKMVEGLDKHFYHDHAFRGVELRLIMDIIGRVVKEMLEDST